MLPDIFHGLASMLICSKHRMLGSDGFRVSWSHMGRACFQRCGAKKGFVSERRLKESFDSGAGMGTVVFATWMRRVQHSGKLWLRYIMRSGFR
jgi:hypothetical protein